jgi:hypothetical protein
MSLIQVCAVLPDTARPVGRVDVCAPPAALGDKLVRYAAMTGVGV